VSSVHHLSMTRSRSCGTRASRWRLARIFTAKRCERLSYSITKISWRHTLCCPASTISSYVLNGGYAYTTIISSKYHGQTLLSHLASLYPHSTPQAWQQKLNNGERTLNRVTATGSESVTLGQTLVWNRPPWMEPDGPQHFEVLFEDPHLLAVNKPSGLPTLPGGGFMENTLLRLVQKQTPNGGDSTQRRLDHWRRSKGSSSVML